ncbi:unnamed protein product [Didymodactylos carnosus]|uniref:Acetyl-CoA hydrolase n=1 Tax=Didymodactylos carnosus TaxID=1234261 RepID=A0A814RCF1_9BILA|nr:unnamed protein product [Didymodactylos carnosus]CAF1131138.1 unnamed protein product [Didymodactylos carnosus]CAF3725621.1 unnamed protein product [Didymodactylos carnosus]CAF3894843.1 unnamed protein product [Didymodactylos carnosus]
MLTVRCLYITEFDNRKTIVVIFLSVGASVPKHLNRLVTQYVASMNLRDIEIIQGLALDDSYNSSQHFFINSLFTSACDRKLIMNGLGSYIPIFLSEIPKLFDEKILKPDVALLQVSPPDQHGNCSYGLNNDGTQSVIRNTKKIYAQINRSMPRVHGNGFIPLNKIDFYIEHDEPLPEVDFTEKLTTVEKKIGQYVSELIDDGSTLQIGVGAIPNSVLMYLIDHKNLGIHTEMLTDGVVNLIEKNVVTNRMKKIHNGKSVCTFIAGTKKLYDFVHDNPQIFSLEVDFVNDSYIIAQNPKVCAINSAIEIDLTGQACADSIGLLHYSGIGGQLDFFRGAALSKHGKPILTLPSQTKSGISRIVNTLKEGATVTSTRGHVHYVVTEYGVAYLFGKNYQQRAKELIRIAHPNHRENLERQAFDRFKHLY